jgi:hypothetical protein
MVHIPDDGTMKVNEIGKLVLHTTVNSIHFFLDKDSEALSRMILAMPEKEFGFWEEWIKGQMSLIQGRKQRDARTGL